MTAPVKSDRMEPYRLAKKCPGLNRTEKRALTAIADACSMRDLECRKSTTTLDSEHGVPQRTLYDGVRGRKREDGSEYFPGLIKRGIVSINAGGFNHAGRPTAYGIDIAVLRALVYGEESAAQSAAQSSAQNEDECSTTDEKVQHNDPESAAQTGQKCSTNAAKVPEVHRRCTNEGTRERETPSHSASSSGSPAGRRDSAKNSGQVKDDDVSNLDRLLDELMDRSKIKAAELDGSAMFSGKSVESLRKILPGALARETGSAGVEYAIETILKGCSDERAFANFGSTLATNLMSQVRAYEVKIRKVTQRAEPVSVKTPASAKRQPPPKKKPWCTRFGDFVESDKCQSRDDFAAWLKANLKDDGAVATWEDFYVRQALQHSNKPELQRLYKELQEQDARRWDDESARGAAAAD